MAWLAVDKLVLGLENIECIHSVVPFRINDSFGEYWGNDGTYEIATEYQSVQLPKGTIKKLIGREMTWEDEPIELK